MTVTQVELSCRDPIVSRDGRPFGIGQGNKMRPVGWPLPSVVAGSMRTAIGKAAGREFSVATAQELLQVAVAGVFPIADGQLYLPAPQDCVVHPAKGPLRVCPQTVDDGGCDLPEGGLRPVMLSEDQAQKDFKPKEAPAWWPLDQYAAWLVGNDVKFDRRFLCAPTKEERTHVRLDDKTGVADEGNIFTTTALPLNYLERYSAGTDTAFWERFAATRLSARVNATGWCGETVTRLNALHPMGGERCLVHWRATTLDLWKCPRDIVDSLVGKDRVRMALATPAIFRDGWKPGWLNDQLIGTPPGANVSLRLIGMCIQRWQAVSGWSLANLPGQPRGPKPVKRMVPASGVYFFELPSGGAEDLATRWLEPVSDDDQDRRDGFGLAVWGTW